jgi:hypothetical protein
MDVHDQPAYAMMSLNGPFSFGKNMFATECGQMYVQMAYQSIAKLKILGKR